VIRERGKGGVLLFLPDLIAQAKKRRNISSFKKRRKNFDRVSAAQVKMNW